MFFYFYSHEEFIEEYEEEHERINIVPFEKPNFILMRYTDRKIMKKCLQAENFPTDVYVDDDDALDVPIVTIQEFIDSLHQ